MKLIPQDRFQRVLFLLFLVFLVASCIKPPFLQFLLMQHVPTVVAVLLLGYLSNWFVVSRLSFSLIIVFLCLHTLGARYLYSYFPYDELCEYLLGVNITDTFGFSRNHYDRLVHFSYGLLLAVPAWEITHKHFRMSAARSFLLAVAFIVVTSVLYELIEWLVAITFTPEWADSFLGQQGDMYDAHKDMALATAGAVLSASVPVLVCRFKRSC